MKQSVQAALAAALVLAACSPDTPVEPSAAGSAPTLSRDRGELRPTSAGIVVTMTNALTGNEAIVYPRGPDGRLGTPTRFATGGNGTGGGLGNQAGIALDNQRRHLYLVNAGSNTVTVFQTRGAALELRQTIASGGTEPISVALYGRLLYVLNDGAPAANIAGFEIGLDGRLSPLQGSTRGLSTATPNAAQISFDQTGRRIIVTEKATNNLVVFDIDEQGRPGEPQVVSSSGTTPFGFAVNRRGHVIVSEAFGGAAGASAVSSYRFDRRILTPVSRSIPTTESAACWIALSGDGRFAYSANAGSATLSGYAILEGGALRLLNPDGVSGVTGAGPIDLATRPGLDFLYSLNGAGGSISAFRINPDGSLTGIETTPGIPAGANGLVTF